MFPELRQRYAEHIDHIETLIQEEVTYWQWDNVLPMREIVVGYLVSRGGKRLRPLLALIFTDLHTGQLKRVYSPAAALEIYHTASLIYDDIQDNSEFRRGLPCAHITASTSTAMNLAAVIRTMMYHCLHRSAYLNPVEKLEIHRRLDQAATFVALGQSIDIGWHEGWYANYRNFPYKQMIQWKSAALFGSAAAVGTFLAAADSEQIAQAEKVGIDIGLLFQMIDDYLDIFGNPQMMRRPLYNDFREGKLTYPLTCLLDQLSARGETEKIKDVLQSLAERDAHRTDWQELVELMLEYDLDCSLQHQLAEEARKLFLSLEKMGTNTTARENLCLFVDALMFSVTNK